MTCPCRVWLPWVFLFLSCSTVSGLDRQFGLEFYNTIVIENNLYNTETLDGFTYDSRGNEVMLFPMVDLAYGEHLTGFFMGEFYWMHYFDDHDDDTDAELANAFVCLEYKKLLLTGGKMPVTPGRGQIYNDNEPALSLDINLNQYLEFSSSLTFLDDSSSLAYFNVGYTPGLFEKLDIFAAYYHGGDNAFSDQLYLYEQYEWINTQVVVGFPYTSGSLSWIGAGADLFVYGNYLQWVAILQRGDIDLTSENENGNRSLEVSSFMIDAELSRNMGAFWSLAGFLRIESGGGSSDLDDGKLKGYFKPSAISYRTLVFSSDLFMPDSDLNGWVSQTITLAGLVSPGFSVSLTPRDDLFINGMLCLFFPYSSTETMGSFYGWELDAMVTWDVAERVSLLGQAGCFVHGDVVETVQGKKPHPAQIVAVGATVHF